MIIQVLLPVVLARLAGAKSVLKIVVLIFGEHNFEDHVHSVKVVVVSVKGDRNGEQFVELFEKKRKKYKVHVQRYINLEINDSLNTSLVARFEEVTSNIVILYATKPHAHLIFAAAFELSKRNKVWMVNEDASKASNVPDGAIASRLSQTPLSALRNSFVSIRNGLTFLDSANETISPPVGCGKDPASSTWVSNHGPHLLRTICSTSTSKVTFNDLCERISVDYDILNYNDGYREVGALRGSNLRLAEQTIHWAGGGAKPLEITLPKHLRAVTMHDPPFVYTTPINSLDDCESLGTVEIELSKTNVIKVSGPWYPCPRHGSNNTSHHCCAGYAIDLLSNLSLPEPNTTIDTSFTFSLHLNDSYGAVILGEKGYILTGALGELDSDQADLAIGGMTINPERERQALFGLLLTKLFYESRYIDFSEPWSYHGIRILEKSIQIPRDSPMQSFLQPLKSSLWTALFVSVITVGLVIFCLDLKSPFDRFYRNEPHLGEPANIFLEQVANERVNFGEAMWFVWGVLLNSGVSEKTPRSCAARVLGIVWCGFCMIMVASYTANLAAFLVLDQPEKGLTGITDPRLRNPSANYSFGTVLNSNVYQYFKRHVELSTMFRKMEAHNVEKTLDAFIWDSTRLDFEAARHCDLRTRGALFGRSAYGVGLQKNSPWTPHITSAILRLSESGVMESLDTKWIDNKESKCVPEVHKSPARLSLWNMRDVFILVTVGVAAGAVFSTIEVIYGRRKARRGHERALAARYVEKWRMMASDGHRANRYNLSRPVIRRGFTGLEPCTLMDIRMRELESSKQNSVKKTLIRPPEFVPDLNFGRESVVLFCSRCRNLVQTEVHRESGLFAYVWCVLFVLLFLWPCSPLPCFMEAFSDFVHICPVCSHKIGRYRRCRRSQFYV
uniref:LITAF domain-containing protein n=1 Tax=Haemonchus contortus TaxID=6289 RepID=A0A7I4Y1B4_HAECO